MGSSGIDARINEQYGAQRAVQECMALFVCKNERKEDLSMSFGEALEALKAGKKARRAGWNGKNQYIELATNISYTDARGNIVNCEHDAIGNKAIAFVGTSGVQMGWLASQADMLAEDWEVVV